MNTIYSDHDDDADDVDSDDVDGRDIADNNDNIDDDDVDNDDHDVDVDRDDHDDDVDGYSIIYLFSRSYNDYGKFVLRFHGAYHPLILMRK